MLDDMRRVRELLETLPFNIMQPCEGVVSGRGSYCLGKSGYAFAIYLPTGGSIQVDLPGTGTNYNAYWFDPRTGAKKNINQVMGGSEHLFNAPDSQDWTLILQSPSGVPGGGLTFFLPLLSGGSN
jgi:hypothetical protein